MIYAKKQITLEALRRMWFPSQNGNPVLQHSHLVDALLKEGAERHWTITPRVIYVTRDKAAMAASLDLFTGSLSIVILNSYEADFRTTIYGGIDSNGIGIPLTKIVLNKRTARFDLNKEIQITFDNLENRFKSFDFTINRLREQDCPKDQAERLLLQAGQSHLMPWSRIGRLIDSWSIGNKLQLLLRFAKMARMDPPLKQMGQIHSFVYDVLKP